MEEDIRRFRVNSGRITYQALQAMLKQLYDPNDCAVAGYFLQYQDDEGDIVTVGTDADLQEAFRLFGQPVDGSNRPATPLHLIVSGKNLKGQTSDLVAITDLLMERLSTLALSEKTENKAGSGTNTKSSKDVEMSGTQDDTLVQELTEKLSGVQLKDVELMIGTEWSGLLVYPIDKDTKETEPEQFPLVLTITKKKRRVLEGTINWVSLKSVTRWIGKASRSGKLRFQEYSAITGGENVSLPNDYVCELVGNMLNGTLLHDDEGQRGKGDEAKFTLKFVGITCDNQFLSPRGTDENKSKRKYGLVTNNSLDGPTEQDRTSAFKKLTEGSDCWYKKLRTENYVPPKRTESQEQIRKSCSTCHQPLFEQLDLQGNKLMACCNYPNCTKRARYDDSYDSDDYSDDYY